MDQWIQDKWNVILDCFFTMVALDKKTSKPIIVPKIEPTTEGEKRLYQIGHANKALKKQHSQTHLFYKPPLPEEISILHETFLRFREKEKSENKTGVFIKDYITPEETLINSNIWCHPQFKNIHNKIFGGFLMKMAFEDAFIAAALQSQDPGKIKFMYLDEIHFIEPVSIGDVLSFASKIIYIEDNIVHVRVKAEVLIPGGAHQRKTTNLFYFVFSVDHIKYTLYPRSYKDGIYFLDAKRRHQKMKSVIQGSKSHEDALF